MSERLGYTFYPKDWWSSDTFFDLPPELRYLYLEIISLLYINEGESKITQVILLKRFGVDPGEKGLLLLESKFDVNELGYWSHPSVNKRLSRAVASRENGKKGGRPKNLENLEKKPRKTHLYKEKEKEKGKEKIIEPSFSPDPFASTQQITLQQFIAIILEKQFRDNSARWSYFAKNIPRDKRTVKHLKTALGKFETQAGTDGKETRTFEKHWDHFTKHYNKMLILTR